MVLEAYSAVLTFLTFFLGLTVGPYQVELAVDYQAATVELYLDEQLIGTASGPPWTLSCDFGEALLPHKLVARALDPDGQELARATQWVNLPRAAAEATLVLTGGGEGIYKRAELAWQANDERAPEKITAFLDGEPVAMLEGRTIHLPAYDPETIHILSAELLFPGRQRARAELVFGGQHGEVVGSELTAVPLTLPSGGAPPDASELERWLTVRGEPVRVVAVEQAPAEVMVVRSAASQEALRHMGRQARAAIASRPPLGAATDPILVSGLSETDGLRLVSSRPTWVEDANGKPVALFPVSENVNGEGLGVSWGVTHLFFDHNSQEEERLAEAVAVAALEASATDRPRAVVVIRRGDKGVEESLESENVRRFLRALRVPLVYWRVDEPISGAEDGWGEPRVVGRLAELNRSVQELANLLRPQFVAWIGGIHLPQDVELAEEGRRRIAFASE